MTLCEHEWRVNWQKNYCDLYWRSVCVFWCLFVLQNIVQRGRWMEQQKLGESCFGSMCVCFYVLRSQSTPSTGAGKTPMDRFTTRFITWNPLCAHGHNFQASKKTWTKYHIGHAFLVAHTLQHKQTNEWTCTAAILTRRHSYKYAASAVVIFLDIKHT